MHEADADQRAEKPERPRGAGGGTAKARGPERQTSTANEEDTGDEPRRLIEEVLRRENIKAAHDRVVQNGGAPGIDGMTVEDLMPYCREHWTRIRQELLDGMYVPKPVRKVEIPKPDGKGTRMLGIPTVLDRMIQQAVLQILQPIFDPTFSDGSFGFRPGRSTHGAVTRAREHIAAGHRWVVDLDRKILRPGEPRRAHGASGSTGEGQTSASPDPALFAGRNHGGRAGVTSCGGDAARRTTFAAPE